MMFWGQGMSWWGYLLMSLNTLVIWGLIIAAAVALVRYLSRAPERSAPRPPHQSTPEQVLAERFARGEIDEEEYRQRIEVLRRPAAGGPAGKP
ncbi:MAG: hypothetical protein GEV03_23145 [Streptosporangiales bacterium]|nr:hypothetical protein [Streptosporangiales bacterium]